MGQEKPKHALNSKKVSLIKADIRNYKKIEKFFKNVML